MERYNDYKQPITENGNVTIKGYGYSFQNVGNSNVFINKVWLIPPGGSHSIGLANPCEWLNQKLHISFVANENETEPQNNNLNFLIMT